MELAPPLSEEVATAVPLNRAACPKRYQPSKRLDLSANHDAEAALSNLGILSRWCKVQQARHTPKHSPNRVGDRFSEGLSIGAAAEIPRSHRPFGQHPLVTAT